MGLFSGLRNRIMGEQPVLHCPRDQAQLAQQAFFDVTLYHCPQCDGRWLPGAQALKFFQKMADPRKALAEFQQQVDQHSQDSSARCAADGAPMRYFTQRGVTLDVCTQCRGIWFDGDELGQLLVSGPQGTSKVPAATDAKAGSGAAEAVSTAAVAVGAAEVAATLFDLFD